MSNKPEIIQQRDELVNKVFDMFDRNNSDEMDVVDIHRALYSMGREIDDKTLNEFLKKKKIDQDKTITRSQFMAMLDDFYTVKDNEINEILEAFKVFDVKETGTVTLKELKKILVDYAKEFNEEECEELFKMIDEEGSGVIEYKEFLERWKYQ